MKKVWKYILSILLVIILATAGTIYYFLNIKTYETADEEIEQIIESNYDIILPGIGNNDDATEEDSITTESNENESTADSPSVNVQNNVDNGDSSTDSNEGATTSSENKSGTTTASKNSQSDTKKPTTSQVDTKKSTTQTDTKKPTNNTNTNQDNKTELTVISIKDLYRPVFKSLESQANAKIDALLSRAIGEYHSKKASGESVSYSYFYQKYTTAGRNLEAKTDETFNYIYTALEKDLKKNGYSPSHAKAFKEAYAEAKKERESALLNKAKESL
jgi:ABC-type cobalt transport system substrate-binding protein